MSFRSPKIFFSFRSPYSWMGLRRLRMRVPDVLERTQLIPFWDPDPDMLAAIRARNADTHYVPMSKPKHLYILHDTKRLAAENGLHMAWPIDVNCHWEVPHLGWLRARSFGAATAFYNAVVEARWARAENICDPAVIHRIASDLGLDADQVAGAHADAEIRAQAADCLVAAYEEDVFGVPYFRLGRQRFWGLDRVDAFADQLVAGARAQRAPLAPGVHEEPNGRVKIGVPYDADTAGGCG